jgi:EAL domain-containing protein (putative c-di-GMP-specific phosphodiesterase class I)
MINVAKLPQPMTERRTRTDRRRQGGPEQAAELAAAIEGGAIEVLFQPQFLCDGGRLAGAEALVRWVHPVQGPLSGDRVFALAHESGLAHRLAEHVCHRAMTEAARWPADLRLSLNATADDLADPAYPQLLQDALARSRFAASRLTLEITEQALVDCLDSAARILGTLTDQGIAVALDDFGAGFCNFRYLKVLPLASLKLDRSMVEGIATDRRDLAVFRAIMAMARALDLRVIAEGIETSAQRDAVTQEGCDRWQGFLGAPPMTAEEFAALAAS